MILCCKDCTEECCWMEWDNVQGEYLCMAEYPETNCQYRKEEWYI